MHSFIHRECSLWDLKTVYLVAGTALVSVDIMGSRTDVFPDHDTSTVCSCRNRPEKNCPHTYKNTRHFLCVMEKPRLLETV